ncbi:MAG: phosphoglycerate kinase [Rickettsiales bacterium]|jgi:phosphoglycerate kinase|nr:phosphoglycerate kinase [Rickettsiales bacterium]
MFNKIKDADVKNKVVFVRADMNVSLKDGKIIDDTRIKATIPTIEFLIKNGAKVVLASHLGKGKQPEESLKIVLERLRILLPNIKFNFSDDCIGDKAKSIIASTNFGEVVLLENLRFHKDEENYGEIGKGKIAEDEEKKAKQFASDLSQLAEIYVNDAFSTCHRKHASMVGIPDFLPAFAGFTLEEELSNLTTLVSNPEKPFMVIVGGSKVSTKLELLRALVKKANYVVVGGGMANTFLYALGKPIGKSLHEAELKDDTLALLEDAKKNNCEVILPTDVVVAPTVSEGQSVKNVKIDDIETDDVIVDLGTETIKSIQNRLNNSKVVIWNGPIGIYEISPFNAGTDGLAKIIADLTKSGTLKSVAGGGDILAALNKANITQDFTYVSTAGGAFLKWLEKGKLPAIEKILK